MRKWPRILAFLIFLVAACGTGKIEPVSIEPGDMCSFCRMAISERQFAAEIITDDERVFKFDDIGCLLRFQQATSDISTPAAIFVTDYDSKQWLLASDAFFVRSDTIKTPMGGGIIAFGNKARTDGRGISFKELKP